MNGNNEPKWTFGKIYVNGKAIPPARHYWKNEYFKKHVRFFYTVIVLFNWKKFVQKSSIVFNLFHKSIAPLFQKRQQKILIAFEISSPCEQLPFRCLKEKSNC